MLVASEQLLYDVNSEKSNSFGQLDQGSGIHPFCLFCRYLREGEEGLRPGMGVAAYFSCLPGTLRSPALWAALLPGNGSARDESVWPSIIEHAGRVIPACRLNPSARRRTEAPLVVQASEPCMTHLLKVTGKDQGFSASPTVPRLPPRDRLPACVFSREAGRVQTFATLLFSLTDAQRSRRTPPPGSLAPVYEMLQGVLFSTRWGSGSTGRCRSVRERLPAVSVAGPGVLQ